MRWPLHFCLSPPQFFCLSPEKRQMQRFRRFSRCKTVEKTLFLIGQLLHWAFQKAESLETRMVQGFQKYFEFAAISRVTLPRCPKDSL
jgi:hypothetical protein